MRYWFDPSLNVEGPVTADHVRELLAVEPPALDAISDDLPSQAAMLWRAFRKGMDWFCRRSRVPREEVMGWLYLKAFDRAQTVSSAWNKAGEAGMVNVLSDMLFKEYPDYKHHEHEVPWDFDTFPDEFGTGDA
nr:MAG TPA: hypothetical protein [Caudoviricetes sp.]